MWVFRSQAHYYSHSEVLSSRVKRGLPSCMMMLSHDICAHSKPDSAWKDLASLWLMNKLPLSNCQTTEFLQMCLGFHPFSCGLPLWGTAPSEAIFQRPLSHRSPRPWLWLYSQAMCFLWCVFGFCLGFGCFFWVWVSFFFFFKFLEMKSPTEVFVFLGVFVFLFGRIAAFLGEPFFWWGVCGILLHLIFMSASWILFWLIYVMLGGLWSILI